MVSTLCLNRSLCSYPLHFHHMVRQKVALASLFMIFELGAFIIISRTKPSAVYYQQDFFKHLILDRLYLQTIINMHILQNQIYLLRYMHPQVRIHQCHDKSLPSVKSFCISNLPDIPDFCKSYHNASAVFIS